MLIIENIKTNFVPINFKGYNEILDSAARGDLIFLNGDKKTTINDVEFLSFVVSILDFYVYSIFEKNSVKSYISNVDIEMLFSIEKRSMNDCIISIKCDQIAITLNSYQIESILSRVKNCFDNIIVTDYQRAVLMINPLFRYLFSK